MGAPPRGWRTVHRGRGGGSAPDAVAIDRQAGPAAPGRPSRAATATPAAARLGADQEVEAVRDRAEVDPVRAVERHASAASAHVRHRRRGRGEARPSVGVSDRGTGLGDEGPAPPGRQVRGDDRAGQAATGQVGDEPAVRQAERRPEVRFGHGESVGRRSRPPPASGTPPRRTTGRRATRRRPRRTPWTRSGRTAASASIGGRIRTGAAGRRRPAAAMCRGPPGSVDPRGTRRATPHPG